MTSGVIHLRSARPRSRLSWPRPNPAACSMSIPRATARLSSRTRLDKKEERECAGRKGGGRGGNGVKEDGDDKPRACRGFPRRSCPKAQIRRGADRQFRCGSSAEWKRPRPEESGRVK